MFRKLIKGNLKERKDRITWRGHEVSRIEAFSDAVFAFAVTLLIVSLEVPKSFAELMESMRSFLPFAICFAMLFQIWQTQNVFFRRYALADNTTMMLNAMLLFTVLFFVYPLKFLFNYVLLNSFSVESGDTKKLFYIYSGGYAAIYLLFAAMYWNAFRHRGVLGLTPSEAFETKTNIYRNAALGAVGLLSVGCAAFGGHIAQFAWLPYLLIWPVIGMIHGRRGKMHRLKHESIAVATTHV